MHNVFQFFTKAAYDACDFSALSSTNVGGLTSATLALPKGWSYYGCSFAVHCAVDNMKARSSRSPHFLPSCTHCPPSPLAILIFCPLLSLAGGRLCVAMLLFQLGRQLHELGCSAAHSVAAASEVFGRSGGRAPSPAAVHLGQPAAGFCVPHTRPVQLGFDAAGEWNTKTLPCLCCCFDKPRSCRTTASSPSILPPPLALQNLLEQAVQASTTDPVVVVVQTAASRRRRATLSATVEVDVSGFGTLASLALFVANLQAKPFFGVCGCGFVLFAPLRTKLMVPATQVVGANIASYTGKACTVSLLFSSSATSGARARCSPALAQQILAAGLCLAAWAWRRGGSLERRGLGRATTRVAGVGRRRSMLARASGL